MQYLLLLLVPMLLSAISVYTIVTPKIYGLSIPKNSIVILQGDARSISKTFIGKQLERHVVKVYECPDKDCSNAVIEQYRYKYRTNGIRYIKW